MKIEFQSALISVKSLQCNTFIPGHCKHFIMLCWRRASFYITILPERARSFSEKHGLMNPLSHWGHVRTSRSHSASLLNWKSVIHLSRLDRGALQQGQNLQKQEGCKNKGESFQSNPSVGKLKRWLRRWLKRWAHSLEHLGVPVISGLDLKIIAPNSTSTSISVQ